MKNKVFIVVSAFTTMLAGCSNMLYSDTLAPVYSRNNAANMQQPATLTQTTLPVAIERPNSSGVIINNSQQNPYANVAKPNDINSMANEIQQLPANGSVNAFQDGQVARPAGMNQMANSNAINNANAAFNNTQNQTTHSVNNALNQNTQQVSNQVATAQNTANQGIVTAQNTAQTNMTQVAPNTVKTANTSIPAASKFASGQSATKMLLQEARTSVAAGKYEKAASALERAHRIEPGNAKILYDISQIRYAQGKYRQAESFASKAANYSKDPVLSKKIWTILGNSRKALGNNSGATAALQKASTF